MHLLLIILTGICLVGIFAFSATVVKDRKVFNWALISVLASVGVIALMSLIIYLINHPK